LSLEVAEKKMIGKKVGEAKKRKMRSIRGSESRAGTTIADRTEGVAEGAREDSALKEAHTNPHKLRAPQQTGHN
jgi:hypothetical protein